MKLPSGVPGGTATVIAVTPAPVIDDGLKVTVIPAGNPVAVRSTGPANPADVPTAMDNVPLLPGRITVLAGVVLTLKSGGRRP